MALLLLLLLILASFIYFYSVTFKITFLSYLLFLLFFSRLTLTLQTLISEHVNSAMEFKKGNRSAEEHLTSI